MTKELNCKWHFASIEGGEDQGPNEAMGQNFKKDPYDALVRESIQNSLDAALTNGEPVVMSFKFKKIESSDYPEMFAIRDEQKNRLEKLMEVAMDCPESLKKLEEMNKRLAAGGFTRFWP